MNNLRFSEAIRLGSLLKPQGFKTLFTKTGGSCAIGAALDAVGKSRSTYCVAEHLWPILEMPTQFFPCGCEFQEQDLGAAVVHLNDTHGWTREAIAEWVSTIENALTAPEVIEALEHESALVETTL